MLLGWLTWKANELTKINNQIDAIWLNNLTNQEEALDDMIKYLEETKKWKWYDGEYWKKIKQQIDKTISKIEEAKNDLKTLSSRKILLDWKWLSEAWILDTNSFWLLSSDTKLFSNLEGIVKRWWLDDLKSLIKTNPSEAKKLLWLANNSDIPQSLIKTINNISDISDIKKISKVLKYAKPIKRMWSFLGKMPYLDLAFVLVDVWIADQWRDYAKQVEVFNDARWKLLKSKADTHLTIWIATAVPEFFLLGLALAGSWPPWWVTWVVALAWTAVAITADYVADTAYFDVQDFYMQNSFDFLEESRTEIKEAIIQITLSWDDSIEKSTNEKFANRIRKISDEQKISTLEAAYETMILFEEWSAPANEERINLRMDYILKHMHDENIIEKYKSSDVNSASFNSVWQFVAKSATYADMIQDKNYKWEKNINKYIESISNDLSNTESANSLAFLEWMDDTEFYWIYKNIINFEYFVLEEWDSNYDQKIKNIEFIKKYYQIKTFGLAKEEIGSINTWVNYSYDAIWDFLSQDELNHNLTSLSYTKNELAEQYASSVINDNDNIELLEVSDDPRENILCSLVKWLYWYTWNNNMQEMIAFMPRSKKESIWLFFGWSMIQEAEFRINNDWASDWKFSLDDLVDMSVSTDDIIKKLVQPNDWLKFINKKSWIDTVTESNDERINLQFWNTFYNILEKERSYLSYYKKIQTKIEIKKYIKENFDWTYWTLPYNLMVLSMKTWLWDCQNCFFSYQNDEIIVATSLSNQDKKISFADKKETLDRPFDQLNEEEKNTFDQEIFPYIEKVDKSKDVLLDIITLRKNNWHKDYFDIPEEYEIIISDKIKEWNKLKESAYDYTPLASKNLIKSRYEEYFSRFDNVYINLLTVSSSKMFWTDFDDADTMNMILLWNNLFQSNIDENWKITLTFAWETFDENTENKNAEKLFDIIETYKIEYNWWNYTINELIQKYEKLLEWDDNDIKQWLELKDKVSRYIEQIRISILEVSTVKFNTDKEWNIHISWTSSKAWRLIKENRWWVVAWALTIATPMFTSYAVAAWTIVTNKLYDYNSNWLLQLILWDNLSNEKYINVDLWNKWNQKWWKQDSNFSKIKYKSFDLWIKELSAKWKVLVESSANVQKHIEKMNNKYVRQNERWNIKMRTNPTPYCESRWLHTSFKFTDVDITIANITFDISNKSEKELEGIFSQIALIWNLINMIKHEFAGMAKWENPFSIWKDGELNFKHKDRWLSKLWTSLKILEPDSFDKIIWSKQNQEKLVKYLNELYEFT